MRDHAVVIGGSIAGLCAARVLSDSYSRVTRLRARRIAERTGEPRGGAPGPAPAHADGTWRRRSSRACFRACWTTWWPRACPMLENRPDCIHLGAAGHVLGTGHTLRDEFTAYVPSRPHLEWQLRRRVQDIDNVEIVRRSVAEPRFDPCAATGDRCAAGPADQGEPEFVRRRPRRRRRRPRHPAAGVVGRSGDISARSKKPSTSASTTPPNSSACRRA